MAWYDEARFYHIYPLGLTGAPKQNDYGEPVHRLRQLFPWIAHIRKIGCTGLYIGPLFESVGHGYETTDYKKVDCRLGTNEDFRKYAADILYYEMDSEVRNIAQNNIPAYADKVRESSYANMVRWDTFSELNTKEEKMERYDEKVSELSDFLEKRLDFLENEWSELIR